MIVWLEGEIRSVDEQYICISCQGVGYGVLGSQALRSLAESHIGEKIQLFIYSHIREDQITLFGFKEKDERDLFLYLHSVSGVGPKTALTFFSHLDRNSIIRAIGQKDIKTIQSIPGIGKKTAERISLELSEKMGDRYAHIFYEPDINNPSKNAPQSHRYLNNDLYSALTNLGYRREDIQHTLDRFPLSDEMSLEDSLRHTLKHLAR